MIVLEVCDCCGGCIGLLLVEVFGYLVVGGVEFIYGEVLVMCGLFCEVGLFFYVVVGE